MSTLNWTPIQNAPITFTGLHWQTDNIPHLWRLPKQMLQDLPSGVQKEMVYASGTRIHFRSNTSQLSLRIRFTQGKPATGLDCYIDGQFWCTTPTPDQEICELSCFEKIHTAFKDICFYLPLRTEIQILEVGIDQNAELQMSTTEVPLPVVLYGSSVAQGIGASRPAMGYASILDRNLNLNLINLGFGGSGKAEPHVVELVSQIQTRCILLDLGKSYGRQTAEPYTDMLLHLRSTHPNIPIVCITPIISSKEIFNPAYKELSNHTRRIVQESVTHCQTQDKNLHLVDGLTLLKSNECDGLASDGVHPNELGHTRIAERLQPILETLLNTPS